MSLFKAVRADGILFMAPFIDLSLTLLAGHCSGIEMAISTCYIPTSERGLPQPGSQMSFGRLLTGLSTLTYSIKDRCCAMFLRRLVSCISSPGVCMRTRL